MKKQVFGTSHVPLSPAVRAGDFVFVSGQVPVDANGNMVAGGIKEQTRQVLENIKAALALAGARMEDVVKTTVYLADFSDFQAMNAVYVRAFPTDPPARATVGVSALPRGAKIELEAIARLP